MPLEQDNSVLSVIKRELTLLSEQLEFYDQLFEIHQERRGELMQDAASGFFALVQMALLESILMRVSRLMDPSESMGYANASFENLLAQRDAKDALRQQWLSLEEKWKCGEFILVRELRNKYLAHNDEVRWTDRSHSDAWIPITEAEFAATRKLSKTLWSLFRCVYRETTSPKERDLLKPSFSFGPPTQVLRCLAGARFLDELLERRDDLIDESGRLMAYIAEVVDGAGRCDSESGRDA